MERHLNFILEKILEYRQKNDWLRIILVTMDYNKNFDTTLSLRLYHKERIIMYVTIQCRNVSLDNPNLYNCYLVNYEQDERDEYEVNYHPKKILTHFNNRATKTLIRWLDDYKNNIQ